jgi:hypothetical protein
MNAYCDPVTMRACLRLLLLAAMLIAPLGRIGLAQAMAMPAASGAMAGHCAEMAAATPVHRQDGHRQKAPARDGEKMAVDCMIACAAMAPGPDLFVAPPPAAMTLPAAAFLSSLTGIQPEADPPPPRFS